MPTQPLELARITQELDQLAYLFLGLVTTGNIGKGRLDLLVRQHARLALAEAHGTTTTTAAALHLTHEEHEDGDNDQDRETGDQQLRPDTLALRLLAFDDHVVVHQVTDQAVVLDGRTHGLEHLAITAGAGNGVTIHGDTLNLAIRHQTQELGVIQSAWL